MTPDPVPPDPVTPDPGPPSPGRLRLVYLNHCAKLSGGELALARLLPALERVDAHVILGEDGPLVELLRQRGVTVEVLPLGATGGIHRDQVVAGRLPAAAVVGTAAYVLRVRRRLVELAPDLVHGNSLKACLYGSVAARLAGLPFVWHARDRIAPDYMPRPATTLVRTAARWLPTVVIANSSTTLDTLQVPRTQTVVHSPVAHDAVDPGFGLYPPEPGTDGVPTIGMVGRLAPWKGQHVFLDALAKAAADGRPFRARVVGGALFGEDDYAAGLHRQAQRLGLADRVTFTGHVEGVAAELRRLDLLVHASVIPEPFGQVVVEGMAAGVPVIASDAGGPAEVVTAGVDGLLTPPGDAAALAAAITTLLDDPGRRAELATAAHRTAAAYLPEVVAAQVQAVYDEALASRRTRGRLRPRRRR